jgi:3-oxoacyl-(acyl-carrier-protein) synthase
VPEVCVTGLGLVTPLGLTAQTTWTNLLQACTAVRLVNLNDHTTELAAPVTDFPQPPGLANEDRSVQFALSAARQAMADAGLAVSSGVNHPGGVVIGSSKGGVLTLLAAHARWLATGTGLDGAIARADPARAARLVAQHCRIVGPRLAVAAACATGLHAVIRGAQLIADGQADLVLAGAADASIHPLFLASLRRLGVLATCKGDPATACRPFDKHRTGFVVGEGAAVLVLESRRHARHRHAPTKAVLEGWAIGADPTGLVQPDPQGRAIAALTRQILTKNHLQPHHIHYINAHGTATKTNDIAETRAIKTALTHAAPTVSINSVKGALGHMMAAAGAAEAAICVLALQNQIIPPTVNLEHQDGECDLDYTPRRARRRVVDRAMCISAGFGGQIGGLLLRREQNALGAT